jgi:hypothetical protein
VLPLSYNLRGCVYVLVAQFCSRFFDDLCSWMCLNWQNWRQIYILNVVMKPFLVLWNWICIDNVTFYVKMTKVM